MKKAENPIEELEAENAQPTDSEAQEVDTVEAEPKSEQPGDETESAETEKEESKPEGSVPVSEHIKLRKRAQEAEQALEQAEREKQALAQQAELAELVLPQQVTPEDEAELIPPNPQDDQYLDDIDGSKWTADFAEYNRKNSERLQQQTQQALEQQRAQAAQNAEAERLAAERANEFQIAQEAHYARADALEAPNFVEVEDQFRSLVGDDLYQVVVETFDNSEQLVLDLGSNKEKTTEILQSIAKSAPIGFKKLFEHAAQLGKVKTGVGNLPEPDEPIEGGAAAFGKGFEAEMKDLRERKAKGLINQNELMNRRKKLKEKYATK